ncbi:creatininase family protein [Paenibacillus sp.]|uniref:creatininase family protein n=1 Tax=Paenibacillus sp. TaxID=58172 RepID=UPI002D6C93C3|nr:creatininase family protein [Paenibacillus sp.]HZG87198.1 creatininase family protein [Paenibacillus sp.]
MKPSTGSDKTLWAELLPHEFRSRLAACPVVYLPLGLCEPHGQVSAFGLDLIKAEWLCREAARRVGGVVAPSMGYHIHEAGYHARWLEEEVGEENPHLTSVPPEMMISFFIYQLRAFANAGFRAVVVLTGHSGGNQADLRRAAERFTARTGVPVWVRSDPELVEGLYTGDHAGKFELSQLMYIRPDLVDMTARSWEEVPGAGGRLALGSDADESNPELGRAIMEACLARLCEEAERLAAEGRALAQSGARVERLTFADAEAIRAEALREADSWATAAPWPGQRPVSPSSQWKPYEWLK